MANQVDHVRMEGLDGLSGLRRRRVLDHPRVNAPQSFARSFEHTHYLGGWPHGAVDERRADDKQDARHSRDLARLRPAAWDPSSDGDVDDPSSAGIAVGEIAVGAANQLPRQARQRRLPDLVAQRDLQERIVSPLELFLEGGPIGLAERAIEQVPPELFGVLCGEGSGHQVVGDGLDAGAGREMKTADLRRVVASVELRHKTAVAVVRLDEVPFRNVGAFDGHGPRIIEMNNEAHGSPRTQTQASATFGTASGFAARTTGSPDF